MVNFAKSFATGLPDSMEREEFIIGKVENKLTGKRAAYAGIVGGTNRNWSSHLTDQAKRILIDDGRKKCAKILGCSVEDLTDIL